MSGSNYGQQLGAKIRAALDESGVTPTALARHFGVATPSVYDWFKTGRIAKERLAELSRFLGKPLGYWLDDSEEPVEQDEKQLLALYRDMPDNMKQKLLQQAEFFHELTAPAPPERDRDLERD